MINGLKVIGLLLATLVFASLSAVAQNAPEKVKDKETVKTGSYRLRDHLFVGGGVQAGFGDVTLVDVSPIVGYKFNERFSAGVGFDYIYYRIKYYGDVYQTNIYGGNVFARYLVWKNFFAHAELGVTNFKAPEVKFGHYTGKTVRVNSFSLPVGVGYRQPIGERSFFEILALYDLLYYQNAYPFRDSPLIIRAGFNFGL